MRHTNKCVTVNQSINQPLIDWTIPTSHTMFYSYPQLARRHTTRSRIGRGRLRRNTGRVRRMASRYVPSKTAGRWYIPAVIHSHQRSREKWSSRYGMHPSTTRVVGNLEKILCCEYITEAFRYSNCGWDFILFSFDFIFQERETYKFTYLRKVMLSLLDSRRELLGATLTQDQTLELQLKVISKIDWGNR